MFKLLSFVFIGGGLGSVARVAMVRFFALFCAPIFPFGTLAVNILGSFLIGLFWAISCISDKSSWVHLLIIGFCGGFTTFSAFSWENFNLLKQGDVLLFFTYTLLSVAVCLFATWGGYVLGKLY